ncbi:MAG: GtrA family protein [bacterium]
MSFQKNDFKSLFWQFFKYGVVGILAFAAYAIINFILIKKMGITAEISIIFANVAGGTTNYLLNKKFTFKNNCDNVSAQIFTFILVNVFIYMFFAQIILYFIHSRYQLVTDDFNATIAVAVIMMPINFVMAKLITFNRKVVK